MKITAQNAVILLTVGMIALGGSTSGKRVLLIPAMWASHILEMSQIGRELADRGHDVHMLMSENVQKLPKSLKQSGIKFVKYRVDYADDPFHDGVLANLTLETWQSGGGIATEMRADMIMGERECRPLLKSKDTFNRIVSLNFSYALVDGLDASLCRYIIPHQAGIPFGSVSSVFWPYISTLASLPSVNDDMYTSYNSSDQMNIFCRFKNLLSSYYFWAVSERYGNDEKFMGSYIPDKPYHSLTNLARQSQFWIIGTEAIMDRPRISLPHIHFVGGLTVETAKLLTGRMLGICDKATDGLVLLSFGSRIAKLPAAYLLRLIEGLNKVDKKYTIIFKYDGPTDHLSIAKSIHIVSWMPQNDILGHRNTRLFITHCGNNGRYEALYHGVPMLAFPFDADQPINALKMVRQGFGMMMDIKTFDTNDLNKNIRQIIKNPKYRNAIKKASAIFRDAPIPREKAASVVEHVMKHGADHWYMPASELSLYQIVMLDIVLIVLLMLALFIIVTKYLVVVFYNIRR